MARYKVLKSVAHNLAHSFTSTLNYVGDDYVMGHILANALQTGEDTLVVDLVSGEGGPPALLLQQPLADLPRWEANHFRRLIQASQTAMQYVSSAGLRVRFDLDQTRRLVSRPDDFSGPYECEVIITDDRGKEYRARLVGSWATEPGHTAVRPVIKRPWWRFW